MISSIDRSLIRHRYKESIMQSPGNIFNATKQALKAKQKDLKQKGKGNKKQTHYRTKKSTFCLTLEFWE